MYACTYRREGEANSIHDEYAMDEVFQAQLTACLLQKRHNSLATCTCACMLNTTNDAVTTDALVQRCYQHYMYFPVYVLYYKYMQNLFTHIER